MQPDAQDEAEVEQSEEHTPLYEIPEDNPFRNVIEQLREDGDTWTEVFEKMDAAFNPVDRAAFRESFEEMPEFDVRVTVPDEESTSGKSYEVFSRIAESEDKAREEIAEIPEVIDVVGVEQTGTVEVA